MQKLTQTAVNVFAILQQFGNGSPDYLEGLLPFFEPLLRDRNGQRLDPIELANCVSETYHWNFTADVLEEFIPRFLSHKWITTENKHSPHKGPFDIQMPEVALQIEGLDSVSGSMNEIGKLFKTFAEKLSPITTLDIEPSSYVDKLIEWLLYIDAYSEQSLAFEVKTYTEETGKLTQKKVYDRITNLTDEDRYLCARFAEFLISTNNIFSDVLCRIASIGLLTEVIQDFNKPTNDIGETDLVLFLDAPIALEYLGVSGASAQTNIATILKPLVKDGVQLRVFSQSVDEMQRTLTGYLNNPHPTGPTARAVNRQEVTREFVKAVCNRPTHFLKQNSIGIATRSLDTHPNEHQFFSYEDYMDLYAGLDFHEKEQAREHDAMIASMIMRMRKEHLSEDLFDSKFLLLTRNGMFSQSARKRIITRGRLTRSSIPPVVHRRVIATASWLRTGLNMDQLDIPKCQILASCERVLTLKPNVVEAIQRFTNKFEGKEEQLSLLLSEPRSAQLLMDKTLGVSSVITEGNAEELFQEMLQPHVNEIEVKFNQELSLKMEEADKAVEKANQKMIMAMEAAEKYKTETESREVEDIKAVAHLLKQVSAKTQNRKKILNMVFFVASMLVGLLGVYGSVLTGGIAQVVSIISVPLFGYINLLTLQGRQFLPSKYYENYAHSLLQDQAGDRLLTDKLTVIDYTWSDHDVAFAFQNIIESVES
jgi:hypothetical protein